MVAKNPDFSGWATKAGLKCSDGRTIMPDAFAHQDNTEVPLVYQHGHNELTNILGTARLEHRAEGVYAYAYFNDTPNGLAAKKIVQHGDIKFLSIYANQLVEKANQVFHGAIREVSLVIAGANPGARIDFVAVQHADGSVQEFDDEAIIHTGLQFTLDAGSVSKADESETASHALTDETVEDVFNSFSDKQKKVVHFMLGAVADQMDPEGLRHADDNVAVGEGNEEVEEGEGDETVVDQTTGTDQTVVPDAASQTAEGTPPADQTGTTTNEGVVAHQEGTDMTSTRNAFEQNGTGGATGSGPSLSHDAMKTILVDAKELGSFKKAAQKHALAHSITNLELMFPEARDIGTNPEMISRRVEWVAKVLDGVKRTPFVNVKTLMADITADEARAKGYAKGNEKLEEVLVLLARSTGPTTIYKKQAMHRDDLLDITEYDVVNWLWAEMRLMIEEEVARAILVGDGRSALSPDKVKDPMGAVDGLGIRSILHDSDLFAVKTELPANTSPKNAVKGIVRARSKYRGSGKPTLFISDNFLTDIMLEEDNFGQSLYKTEQELVDKLRVKEIVTVDLFDEYPNLFAIMVSLNDYNVGTNAGGQLTRFEDFDIDFNLYKYLQETRLSGALVKPYSAVVVRRGEGTLAVATQPSFNGETNTITVPTVTGVNYVINGEVVDGEAVVIDRQTEVEAEAEEGFYLESNTNRSWIYNV